jgi:three-Cys-motif partner protein
MSKNPRDNTVGPWAKKKLEALSKYLEYYCTALKNQHFKLIYIDGFAGEPTSRLRSEGSPSITPVLSNEFFENKNEQIEFINGSPRRALDIEVTHKKIGVAGFHEYYFIDLDKVRAQNLEEIAQQHKNVKVQMRDCNQLIRALIPNLSNKNIRGIAFLDPYGAHLQWSTLEALAKTKTMEVIINLPIAMAINRLMPKNGQIVDKDYKQLTDCFGTKEWYDIAYGRCDEQQTLFEEERSITKNKKVSKRLLNLYIKRLKNIFECVATPSLIKNTRGNPLYYLIWAGPNKLGFRGANHILSQGDKVSKKNHHK